MSFAVCVVLDSFLKSQITNPPISIAYLHMITIIVFFFFCLLSWECFCLEFISLHFITKPTQNEFANFGGGAEDKQKHWYETVGVARQAEHQIGWMWELRRRTVQTETEEMAAQQVSVLITGANRGLGLEMVKQMMEAPCQVRKLFACCRDPDGPRAEVRVCTVFVTHWAVQQRTVF